MTLTIKTFSGPAAVPYFDDVARLRIEVFRAFPYLYEGSADYERKYLSTYARSPGSIFVLAFDGDEVVGAATGTPMKGETREVKAPFTVFGYNTDSIFYFGESILKSGYRGRGIGVRFIEERENHARSLGGMTHCTFCAVERPETIRAVRRTMCRSTSSGAIAATCRARICARRSAGRISTSPKRARSPCPSGSRNSERPVVQKIK